tara:strand:+ start:285 stop:485 length:201 start_codon:yes stop_codon:yes gene_type:complete
MEYSKLKKEDLVGLLEDKDLAIKELKDKLKEVESKVKPEAPIKRTGSSFALRMQESRKKLRKQPKK